MNIFNIVFFWGIAAVVSAIFSFIAKNTYGASTLIMSIVFLCTMLISMLIYAIARGVINWMSRRKKISKSKPQEPVQVGGLKRVIKNTLAFIKDQQIAGGAKYFWTQPWELILGTASVARETLLQLHTRFSVGDCEDKGLRQNSVYVLDKSVLWDVSDDLLKTDTSPELNKQWSQFLKHVQKKKKPKAAFEQIIVQIPASLLLNGDKREVSNFARILRDRVDQVANFTGFRQHIVFNICDTQEITGFKDLVNKIPEECRHQAMGYVLDDPYQYSSSGKPITSVAERSQELIDILLCNERTIGSLDILKFPLGIDALQTNYLIFTELFFSNSDYTETPLLQGVFFSGNVEGESAFSYDFISKIAPNLLHPMKKLKAQLEREKKRFIRCLGLWYAVCFVFACFINYSYTGTSNRLIDLIKLLPKKQQFSKSFERNLVQFDKIHSWMEEVMRFREQWTIRLLPFHGGLDRLYDYYTVMFVKHFQVHIIDLLDIRIASMLRKGGLSDEEKTYVIQNIASRVNILNLSKGGNSSIVIHAAPSPEIRYLGYNKVPDRLLHTFGRFYKDFVVWMNDKEKARQKTVKFVLWMEESRLLHSDFHWLLSWGNTQDTIIPYMLSDFWPGSDLNTSIRVDPTYTMKAYKSTKDLINLISGTLPIYIDINRQIGQYDAWYTGKQLLAWKSFTNNFDLGINTLSSQYEWDKAFSSMLTKHGAYYYLLESLVDQFQYKLPVTQPHWLVLAKDFSEIITIDDAGQQKIETENLSQQVSTILDKYSNNSKARQNGEQSLASDTKLDAVKSFIEYYELLTKLYDKPYTHSYNAYTIAKKLYEAQTRVVKDIGIFTKAYQSLIHLRRTLEYYDELNNNNPFWKMLRGPLDFYVQYTNRYASCYVQQKWMDEVYLKSVSIKDEDLKFFLFGEKGLLWDFHKKYLEPFMRQVGYNYMPVNVLDHKFPLAQSYYHFLKQGRRLSMEKNKESHLVNQIQEKFPIGLHIKAKPINLNHGAKVLPFKTVLKIRCKKANHTLENYNYPSQLTLKQWSLESCGKTSIEIHFPTRTLIIDYPGKTGFLEFVVDFYGSGKTFSASYFSEHRRFLRTSGIESFRVQYDLIGLTGVRGLIKRYLYFKKYAEHDAKKALRKLRTPRNITYCWEQSY